jgi:hypothetical protein
MIFYFVLIELSLTSKLNRSKFLVICATAAFVVPYRILERKGIITLIRDIPLDWARVKTIKTESRVDRF